MSGPPEHIPPSSLFLQLSAMPRPFRVVDIPRTDPVTKEAVGQIAIQVLTQEEQMVCASAAEAFARKIIKEVPKSNEASLGYEDLYKNAAAVEVLYRACRDKDDVKKPAFPSPGEMRRVMSADEIGVLMSHYFTVQSEVGPIMAHLSEAEEEAWIRVLGEGGSMLPLDRCSSGALKSLAFTLACRLHRSLTDTSSVGSQPENAG